MSDGFWVGLMTAVAFTVMLAIFFLVWVPAIAHCNALGGELVTNAFNWPVCVPSTK